jgi:CheY-like chemotaxis protein
MAAPHANQVTSIEGSHGEPGLPLARRPASRIVVVDDDSDLRELLAARLRRIGYEVHELPNGLDLICAFQGIGEDDWILDGVDLILIDNRMPAITGLDVIRRLRAARFNTPAILMTAFPQAALEQDALTLGLQVLAKPFTQERLTRAILQTLVARRSPS